MGVPRIIFKKPCLALELGLQAEDNFQTAYYNEISPVLFELGVPPQTIPVLAKETPIKTVRLAQAAARREDLETLIRPLIVRGQDHLGEMPDKLVIYLSELFDHYAWVTDGEWTIVMNPAIFEDFEVFFPTQVAHNLVHCARYSRIRDSFKKETKLDLFRAEHRRQYRVNIPLAEDVINEGIAAVGSHFIVEKYPAKEIRPTWYDLQVSRLLQEFFGARNVNGQDRLLFMNDRSALPPGHDWRTLPREMVFVGHYLGFFIVNHAIVESQLPFKRILDQTANQILDLGFAHMRRPRKK